MPESCSTEKRTTVPLETGHLAVRLASAASPDELGRLLDEAAHCFHSKALLVLYRSREGGEEGEPAGFYEVIARGGRGPLGVPTRIPWGEWGPADRVRDGLPAAGGGPHPFGAPGVVLIGGPAASPSGLGSGLAVLAPADAILDAEILDLLARAAEVADERGRRLRSLTRSSLRDPLTGVLNRKALDESFVREMKRASRPNNVKQTSLLMVDLDGFKAINDEHGHEAGDHMLRAVASAMRRVLRIEDILARYGGDEFAVLLPETPAAGAMRVAEKIRGVLAGTRVSFGGRTLRIGASIGASTDPGEPATFDHVPTEEEKRALARRFAERIRRLLSAADAALYRAKAEGRGSARHADEG